MTPIFPRRRTAGAVLTAFFLVISTAAFAEVTKYYDLPEGRAQRTLKIFSEQAGLEVVFPTDTVEGVQTNPVHGDMTAREAIDSMLAGTALEAVQDARTAGFSVRRRPAGPQPAPGRDPARPAATHAPLQLNEMVVTGSVMPQSKLESALAVTTLDDASIRMDAPRSTAELLKLIPGIFTEAGGGEAGNNITVRGVVQSSSGPNGYFYVALQEDGLPVLSESQFRFTQADDFYRVSDFVSQVEAVRGGTSAIFASSDPLGIVNLISREGTQTPHGEFKLEVSDYGEFRNEGYVAGPINSSTTFAAGGFYRVDHGMRDPGFTADKGGQFMGNLKYAFPDNKGHLSVSGKLFDDRPLFLGEMPFYNASLVGTVHPQTIPGGPDIQTGSFAPSPDTRFFSFPNTPAGPLNYDLADGYMASYYYAGADLAYDLTDTLHLRVLNRYTNGYHLTNSLSSNVGVTFNAAGIATAANLTSLQNIADSLAPSSRDNGAFAAALLPNGHYDFMLTYPGFFNGTVNSVAAANPAAAATLNGNGLGSIAGWGFDRIQFKNFQEDIRLTQTWNDGRTTLTGGFYYADFRVGTFGESSQELLGVSPRAQRLDITYLNAATGAPIGQYTYHGITALSSTYLNNDAEKKTGDWFADLTQKFGPLSLDAGYRYMTADLDGSAEQPIVQGSGFTSGYNANPSIGPVASANGGLGFFPALTEATFGNGNWVSSSNRSNDYAVTAGANLVLAGDSTAVFARYSRAPKMNYTNDILQSIPGGNNAGSAIVPFNRNDGVLTQEEMGLKYNSGDFGVFLTGFAVQGRQIAANATIAGTVVNSVLNENVIGLEIEGVWAPGQIPGLSFTLHGTVQSPKYVAGSFSTTDINPATGLAFPSSNLSGLQPVRVPKAYGTLIASYSLPRFTFGTLGINASCQYTGRNPLDVFDELYAAPFYEAAAGASFSTPRGVTFRVNVSNLFQSDGITEGNPLGAVNASNVSSLNYFTFRPVMPRSAVASVTYAW